MTGFRTCMASVLIVSTALFARTAALTLPLVGGVLLTLPMAGKASAEDKKNKKGHGAARHAPSRSAPHRTAAPRHFSAPRAVPHFTRRAAPRRAIRHATPRRDFRHTVPPTQQRRTVIRSPAVRHLQQRNAHTWTRQNLRNERALRQREQRELRALSRSRRHLQGATAPLRAARKATPRTTTLTATQQAAARGRFGARFRGPGHDPRAHTARYAGRHAWRRGLRASFVAWAGPLFWPYVYSDIFDYTFFPYAYDDGFWAYAYDDFFDSVFWPDGGPYAGYAYAGPYGGDVTGALPDQRASANARQQRRLAEALCRAPGQGVTAWPFGLINEAVRPTKEQRALLADLKAAAAKAANTFKRACSAEVPLTPPGRLGAMSRRLQATLDALKTVRPALVAFYDSLSDEQKARFNAIGPEVGKNAKLASSEPANVAATCGEAKPGLTNLPMERIAEVVRPSDQQKEALDRLSAATKEALGKLQAACPDQVPQTPVGRLQAMEQRLQAMVEAASIVQPALTGFYASLSNEQKARFNTMGLGQDRAAN